MSRRIQKIIAVVLVMPAGLCTVNAQVNANRLGEMVTIPAGSFLMGNNGHEGFGGPDSLPDTL